MTTQQRDLNEVEIKSLEGYQHDGQRISSPGKFEGEPIFAPYFWDLALQGFADRDNGRVFVFKFEFNGADKDIHFKAQLKKWLSSRRTLQMCESSQGFVVCI
jgi:hypothetical protein